VFYFERNARGTVFSIRHFKKQSQNPQEMRVCAVAMQDEPDHVVDAENLYHLAPAS
jgi:hypothetical protein